jgi:hypothetical protein
MFTDKAIYKLYPNVKTIIASQDCYDAQGNVVQVDWDLVNAESANLQHQSDLQDCKKQASALLYETDWTTIPDVADPANSPYLTNQAEFIAWRNQVRALAVNPVADPVFPTKPNEVWG